MFSPYFLSIKLHFSWTYYCKFFTNYASQEIHSKKKKKSLDPTLNNVSPLNQTFSISKQHSDFMGNWAVKKQHNKKKKKKIKRTTPFKTKSRKIVLVAAVAAAAVVVYQSSLSFSGIILFFYYFLFLLVAFWHIELTVILASKFFFPHPFWKSSKVLTFVSLHHDYIRWKWILKCVCLFVCSLYILWWYSIQPGCEPEGQQQKKKQLH